ncbi:MAG TPA: DUF192 domain-containing protein [Acidimicrobiia bacterium]|nr:DUF192 domain-containing protein [Acidimicrobiia bacterium]
MSCATTSGLDGFETGEVAVGEETLSVAVASTALQRSRGLSGVDELPRGLDGMLFTWSEPSSTSFHMRDVGLPLDVWFFDADGSLIGSARMETCLDGTCSSYATPGPVMWALETPAGEFSFAPGAILTVGS